MPKPPSLLKRIICFKIGLKLGLTLLLVAGGFFLWGRFVEPEFLGVTHMEIPLKEWKGLPYRCKVVLVSDIHAAPGEEERVKRIVKKVTALSPDFILLLGDLCKGHALETTMPPDQIVKLLAPLPKAAPTYAVLGNHDFFARQEITRLLEQAGITQLERKFVIPQFQGTHIQFSGIPDVNTHDLTEADIPKKVDPAIPNILLSHTPDILEELSPKNDNPSLVVAGHTHGGQICLPGGFPLITSSHYGTKYAYGYLIFENKKLVVTRGLGTSLIPIRCFCPPEIMFLTLYGE